MLLRFEMKVTKRRVVSKIEHKFALLTPAEVRGGVGKNAEWDDRVHPMAERPIYV